MLIAAIITYNSSSNPDPQYYRIHMGMHHKFKKDKGEQIRYAVKIIGYPDLEMDKLRGHFGVRDDIALIKLNAPVTFTDTVKPSCLPSLGWDLRPGEKCFATGWGETRGSGFSHVLKQTMQTVLSEKECDFDPKHQICVNHPGYFNSPCHKTTSTVSDVIVRWKRRGSGTAEKRTDRPKILGERSHRALKRAVKQNCKSSLVEISQEFQSSSGISVSSRTVRRELKNLGFHGRAAAHKPNITPQNAKH
ncbi:apolipoprotein(A) [Trichonephila clavipes]|nr:apolipoprotein(A) [Trichonephila clavipes]